EGGLKAQPIGKWIDQDSFVDGGRLQQAQLGPIDGFAKEFGIDRNEIIFGAALAEGREHRGGGNELHEPASQVTTGTLLTGDAASLQPPFPAAVKSCLRWSRPAVPSA